ncbi:MAG TPA: hypothetical protein VJ180_15185 [Pyrinomonadaceae bacterium]|nr:hypothetical protein [Pyrinomonadaceae bacterium]
MLRVTACKELAITRLRLEGKLAGDSVDELEKCWRRTSADETSFLVDLTSVDFIDGRGKQLLTKMYQTGALLLSKSLMAKCLIEEIEHQAALDYDKEKESKTPVS